MTKKNSIFVCQECSFCSSKWLGKCAECNGWNTMIEEARPSKSLTPLPGGPITLMDLSQVDIISQPQRHMCNIGEFDRAVGGGLVLGSSILFYGEPGIGKSTLLLQIADATTKNGLHCLYVTGEESATQIKMRAQRLGIDNSAIKLLATTSLSSIAQAAKRMERPAIIIIDSIQTMAADELDAAPGTVSQIKMCTYIVTRLAKELNITFLIVGHVTKEGQVAGPKMLEHMVDTVLSFEGDSTHQYRIIRSIKNRFGSTNEIGVFSMAGDGLVEVNNPSSIFLSESSEGSIGSCIFPAQEGTRTIMLEVQSLVAKSFLPSPRRSAVGWDNSRLSMMIAILMSHINANLSDKEIYLNIAGGLKVGETAVDLAVAVALISATYKIIVPRDTVFFGEIGLLGELRQVNHDKSRIKEAAKLGFSRVVMPYSVGEANNDSKNLAEPLIKVVRVHNMQEIVSFLHSYSDKKNNNSKPIDVNDE